MQFDFDEKSLFKDGKRWFPIMGEIHYSRIPHEEWADALEKMKRGGVNIASAYAFWIHHEEIQGEYDFGGCRDLRKFTDAVKAAGLYMFLRIGPWCHGEVRNGGFPDWLLEKDFAPRTNDDRYFAEVEKWYSKVYEQAEGLFVKDGGAIIGVQIENEYGHCGGLKGEDGEEHMRRLTAIAKKVGFDAPLWTATGWGGAVTGGLLPVMGGYCDAPWDSRLEPMPPSGNFVFTRERNDHNIGSDHGVGYGLTFDASRFPFLTAELGGGLQVTRKRRPISRAADAAAMSVVKMGSGANLLGYYMYCGGVNPAGKRAKLHECPPRDYTEVPEKCYDFRAPIGAFGQMNETWRELGLLARFAADFGEDLAGMDAHIPDDNPLDPADTEHLRYSVRHNGEWGFVFFNNYVKGQERRDFLNVQIEVLGQKLPPFDVKSGEYGFYTFNMPVVGGVVRFAEAVPFCKIGTTTYFYGKSIDATEGADVKLITKEQALAMDDFIKEEIIGECDVARLTDNKWQIKLDGVFDAAFDYGLKIKYAGESARAYVNGELAADDFYSDGEWYIGLRRLGFPSKIDVEIEPLFADTPVYIEERPPMSDGRACAIESAVLVKFTKIL